MGDKKSAVSNRRIPKNKNQNCPRNSRNKKKACSNQRLLHAEKTESLTQSVEIGGLEPPTSCMRSKRSSQLSYTPEPKPSAKVILFFNISSPPSCDTQIKLDYTYQSSSLQIDNQHRIN